MEGREGGSSVSSRVGGGGREGRGEQCEEQSGREQSGRGWKGGGRGI